MRAKLACNPAFFAFLFLFWQLPGVHLLCRKEVSQEGKNHASFLGGLGFLKDRKGAVVSSRRSTLRGEGSRAKKRRCDSLFFEIIGQNSPRALLGAEILGKDRLGMHLNHTAARYACRISNRFAYMHVGIWQMERMYV